MNAAAPQSRNDPLYAFPAGAFIEGTKRPVPLVKTAFDVRIDGGLAAVVTHRTFRNAEDQSIEATITFPVPVHAVLFNLEAKIGGRLVKAHAQRKDAARAAYEGAIEAGKTTVLHEEVLRGVHMLSVGHIPPGAEIEITAGWAQTLTNIDGLGTLRIPLTVGDIYGRSGLPDSDDLITGGEVHDAGLSVACRDGAVTLIGGRLENGRATVRLNAPVDLAVAGWMPHDLTGRAADGRVVTLRVEPASAGHAPLDVALLVDHSGSMNEACSTAGRSSKHQAATEGLRAIADTLAESDRIDLWQFNDQPTQVGTTRGGWGVKSIFSFGNGSHGLPQLIERLQPPTGGTEIGGALRRVVSESSAKDVLMITDGKSHALDVQSLARTGRCFSVVLVGDDSLEANVGHLAALTGGEIFVAAGSDLASPMQAALRALRSPHVAIAPISGRPETVSARRAGMSLTARWQSEGQSAEAGFEGRAVAAFASSLALAGLDVEAATAIAEAEGLVTHLTSLVLVDDEGGTQEGIPGNRKVPLPAPATAIRPAAMDRRTFADAAPPPPSMVSPEVAATRWSAIQAYKAGHIEFLETRDWLSELAEKIDWDLAPKRIQSGDLSDLDSDTAQAVRNAAGIADVVAAARQLGLDPIVLIIGMAARQAAAKTRSAARIAKAIFRGKDMAVLTRLLRALGL